MLKKFGGVAASLVILAAVAFGAKTLYDAGAFDRVWNHPLPGCHVLKGLVGTEDLVAIPGTHSVVISSADRSHIRPSSANGLYLLDMDQTEKGPVLLSNDTTMAWNPQGMSLWSAGGVNRLFVVNRGPASDSIAIFDLDGEHLVFVKSVPFPSVRTLNAVQALGPDSFFASQDLGAQSAWGQQLEKYLQLPHGRIWLYDQGKLGIAQEGLLYPNGLALSLDGKNLYVASMLGRSLLVYSHDAATHALSFERELFLDTAPDNLRWSPDHRLVIGAHLRLLDLAKHIESPLQYRAAAQLIAVEGLPLEAKVEEIYSSQGKDLSAVTSGLYVAGSWIMGSAFDEGLLICKGRQDVSIAY